MLHMAEMKYADRVWVGKPDGKREPKGPSPVWQDNADLKVKGLEGLWTKCIWLKIGTSGWLL